MSSTGKPESPREFPWPQANGIYHKYDLHCHCGAIRLTMNISPPIYEEHAQGKETYTAIECHCSFCARNGSHSVHPLASNVTWTRGYDTRGEYRLGSKKNPQIFCKTCGSVIATDLSELMKSVGEAPRYTINLRMLKDYDPKLYKLRPSEFMKNMPPNYTLSD